MRLLDKPRLEDRLRLDGDCALRIDPLLEPSQVGEVTIDLRLGYDFLVSIHTRKPYISVSGVTGRPPRGVGTYFNETRREIGDHFMLYPGQMAITTTLEYVCLPADCYADLLSRSSYTRLGVHVNTMVQPGYRGCFNVELFNHSNNPVELVVGSRVFQMRIFEIDVKSDYGAEGTRKYVATTRPTLSRAADDEEQRRLEKVRNGSGFRPL